jgi:DNA-binding SARP family transcriptional activator/TolB-like protein
LARDLGGDADRSDPLDAGVRLTERNLDWRITGESPGRTASHQKVTRVIVLRINALGGLFVERDGHPLAGAAAQPRRLAILALLARADDRGVTRDRLMAVLWPDADDERARRALTQAVYALRQDLGDDAAIAGVKELRLNLELVSTDLREFTQARKRDSLEDAAAAYRGSFLDGFHLPGLEEFERWSDTERRAMSREYAEVVEQLALRAEARKEFTVAAGWWQRLAALDPLNARIAVSLMRAFEAAGDPHGAIQHARVHEALLEQHLDLPPDREVIALAARLRREARRQSTEAQTLVVKEAADAEVSADVRPAADAGSAPAAVREVTLPVADPAPVAAPNVTPESAGNGSSASAHSEPEVLTGANVSAPPAAASPALAPVGAEAGVRQRDGRSRKWWPLIATGVAVSVAAAAIVKFAMAPTVSDQSVVVVGRIADYAGDGSRGVGSPLGDMLATNLARAPGLRVVSSARMYEILGRVGSATRDTSLGVVISAARQAGATELVDGSVYKIGEGRLRLDLRTVDVASGAVLRAYTIEGADLFALADSGSLRLVKHLGATLPPGSLADVSTRSAVAYRLYVDGLRAFSIGDRERADSLFAAALHEDSTFAMAAYYHALSARAGSRLFARAVELSASASERERLIIRSEWALANSSPAMLAFAESLSTRFPAEVEGHLYYGRALVTAGRFLESVPVLQRVMDMDSTGIHGPTITCSACDALAWMIAAYLHADSASAAERVARRWVAARPDSPVAWLQLGGVLESEGQWTEASQAFATYARLQPKNTDLWQYEAQAYVRQGDFARAERVAGAQAARSPGTAAWWVVIALRHAGRFREAIDTARRSLAMHDTAVRPAGMLVAIAQSQFESGQYQAAAATFEQFSRDQPTSYEPSGYARQRAWALTHVADALAAAGDTGRLAQIVDSVRILGAQSAYGRDVKLHHHVRGLLLRARGDARGAADEFAAAIWTPTLGFTRSNLELGKTLLSLGRSREAITAVRPALRGSAEASNYYVTATELHELLARAWDAAGRPDSATVHYAFVARGWEHADPPYARRAAEAQARVVALRASGSGR